jgi:hypothetical protein
MLELQQRPSRRLLTLLDLAEGTPEGVFPPDFGASVGADITIDEPASGFQPSVGDDVITPEAPDFHAGFGPGWGPSVGADIETDRAPDR